MIPTNKRRVYECLCDCGNTKVIIGISMRSGGTRSCGCITTERLKATPIALIHGMRDTDEYMAWASMRSRCYSVTNPSYKTQGARGIRVCPDWKNSYANFYSDMGPRPTPKHRLRRLNNTKDYSQANCVWAIGKPT